ncbi:MAG: aminotransferase class I/II-fold pyridoxal phosphate-dependent enzyme [Phyllobacteriaceae bacterium]|nr:aminotransferase class I/II-fold pyridoxal phosphate-dependent enzyme [Phyllobacteriaceae bacterium]
MRSSAPPAETRSVAAIADPRWDTSFATLPVHRMVQTQRAAGELIGLTSPFHRLHESRSGAHALIEGRECLNFASYDYLGLNGHPEITAAVAAAAEQWGTSVSASRLTAGERPAHRDLERALAEVYGTESALVFVSGHATNVTAIAALLGPKDLVVHDSLAHNSIVVGAVLSGAHRRIYQHNDLDALEQVLEANRGRHERCLVVTEGLFSMDGDGPDLARLVEIKERWGAWLMVDEAHSLGVLGTRGLGIAEHSGVDPRRVDIWMGTLSKTLVGCGGYIAGSEALIDILKYQAPGMVYSVGLPVPLAVASLTALELMRREPERVARLQRNGRRFLDRARAAGLDVGTSWGYAVSPVVVGDSLRTVVLADRLFERGINAFPIIPPGVPEKSARLRFFISAAHTPDEIDHAVDVVAEELDRLIGEGLSVTHLASLLK